MAQQLGCHLEQFSPVVAPRSFAHSVAVQFVFRFVTLGDGDLGLSPSFYIYVYLDISLIIQTALFILLMIVIGIALSVLLSAFRYVGLWHPKSVLGLSVGGAVFIVATIVFAASASTDSLSIGGISAYNGETWQTFTRQPTNGFLSELTESFFEDSHGYLWVAGQGGVGRYDGTEWESIGIGKFSVSGQPEYLILEDTLGRFWFAGGGDLTMYDGTEWRSWPEPFREPLETGQQGWYFFLPLHWWKIKVAASG